MKRRRTGRGGGGRFRVVPYPSVFGGIEDGGNGIVIDLLLIDDRIIKRAVERELSVSGRPFRE